MDCLIRTLIFMISATTFLMFTCTGSYIPPPVRYQPTNLETSTTEDSTIDGDFGPRECPNGMKGRYHQSNTVVSWICECQSNKLFFRQTQSCYDAYTRGPCMEGEFFLVPVGEEFPRCAKIPKRGPAGFIGAPDDCPPRQRKDAQGVCRPGIKEDEGSSEYP